MCSNVFAVCAYMMSQVCIRSFRPTISECRKPMKIAAALNAEVVHYRGVAKKYKRAKKIVNWSATGSGVLSASLSTASLGSALSVVGLPASIPLGSVGGAFALVSSGLIIASKKLDSKIKKHQEIVTLAIAKRRYSLQASFKSSC